MGNSNNSQSQSQSVANERRDLNESLATNSVHALGAAGGGGGGVGAAGPVAGKSLVTAPSPGAHHRFFHLGGNSAGQQSSSSSSTKRKTKSKDSLLNSSFDANTMAASANCCLHQTADFLDVNSLLNSSATVHTNTIGKKPLTSLPTLTTVQGSLKTCLFIIADKHNRSTASTFMTGASQQSTSGLTNIVNPMSLLQASSTPKTERKKWISKDNLYTPTPPTGQTTAANPPDGSANSTLYVAMYDYIVNLDKHLNLHKDDRVYVLSYNKTQEWCEVQNSQTGQIGWVSMTT